MWLIKKWDSTLKQSFYVQYSRRIHLHEDTRRNGRSTWRILYVKRYIGPEKIYLQSCTSSTLLVQGIYKDIDPQGGFKLCKTYLCLLFRLNELGTIFFIVYVYDTLEIGDKPALMDTIECINKYYSTRSVGELEDFIVYTVKWNLTKMTLNISQPDLINKMTQVFN